MNVESLISNNPTGQTQLSKGAELVTEGRKKKDDVAQQEQPQQNQVQPEELLQQINALTEGGLYSVRFENDNAGGGLVVKIVDRDNDEVIRQIPSEELLELTKRLDDLRGNLVTVEG